MKRHLQRVRARFGRWVPLAMLILAVGVAAAGVHEAQRAIRSHHITAQRLVRDYGAFAAWSFRQRAELALQDAFFAALGPALAPGGSGPAAPATLLALSMDGDTTIACAAGCGPRYFFRISLDDGDGTFAGVAPDDGIRRAIAEDVRQHAKAEGRLHGAHVITTARDQERSFVYVLAGTSPADRAAVGFAIDSGWIAPRLERVFTADPLLPAALARGRANSELLQARVTSPSGATLFAADAAEGWEDASVDTLSDAFGSLVVRAGVRPAAAGSLGGSLAKPRLPLLIGLLILASGLGVMAIHQLRREAELARLRSDFVSSVSHELRTPLAQVQLFLETLRLGRYRTEEQRQWILSNMERETTRLTALVNNILHFARSGRSGAGGSREAVRLEDFLRSVVISFEPLAASRGTRFECAFEPGLVALLNAESFRQVLLNLLDNAVKYGPPGQTVRISSDLHGGHVRISVEDEGPGIAAHERDAVWKPFRRGERAVGSVAVGSGIGLAVVREIVEWHEGTALIENASGGGARFAVLLPGWRDPAIDSGETSTDLHKAEPSTGQASR